MKKIQASREATLIFIATTECVVRGFESGLSKEDFFKYAGRMWETVELKGWERVRQAINKMMTEDEDED